MRMALLNTLLIVSAATAAPADLPDFSGGVFIVNEDWYGHQNSTVNYYDPDSDDPWIYRVVQTQNPGRTLGCTNQFGQIYGGRFYLIAKQDKDPGESVAGGRITVCDASTMKILCQLKDIDPSGKQCDGRSYLGVDEHKGYISTSNGVWVFDTDRMEVTGMIKGTANPEAGNDQPVTNPGGSLYHGQCGSMIRVNERVFVAHQSLGLLVVDPERDLVTDTIGMNAVYDLLPEPSSGKKRMPGIGSVVLAKDGSLWVSVARDVQGSGATLPYLMRVNPATLECSVVNVPRDVYPPANSWYAWTPDGFCASARENVLYWNGGPNSWFSNSKVYKYDIDSNEFSLIIDLEKEGQEQGLDNGTSWRLYGCSMRPHPVTDRLYVSLFHNFQDPTYKLRVADGDGKTVREVDMIQNYWFPSLPVFPDNLAPEAHDPGVLEINTTGVQTLDLEGDFTDGDSMEAAIVKSVVSVSAPSALKASIVNGNLQVTPLDLKTGEEVTVRIKANSNGKLAYLDLRLRASKSGVDSIDAEREETPVYYNLQGIRTDNPRGGVFIRVMGNKTERVIIM